MKKKLIISSVLAFSFILVGSQVLAAAKNVTVNKAYTIVRAAYGDKIKLLDIDRATGSLGIFDCIKAGQGISTSSPEVNSGTVYGGKASTTLDRLRDIRSKLSKCTLLDANDKKGLAAAHNAALDSYCQQANAAQYKADYAVYNKKKADAKASSTAQITICNKNFGKCVTPAAPLYGFAKSVNTEGCQVLKDKCIAEAYTAYNSTLETTWKAFGDPTNQNMVVNKIIKCNQADDVKSDYTAI